MNAGTAKSLAMAGAAAFAVIAVVPAPQPALLRLCASGVIRYIPAPGEEERSRTHSPCHALRPKEDARKSLRRGRGAE